MINKDRLEEVHYNYPFTARGQGKTTYVYDCLLRSAQTHFYNELYYVTSTAKYARLSIRDFKCFLMDNNVCFKLNEIINRITIFDYDGTNHKEIDIFFIGVNENKYNSQLKGIHKRNCNGPNCDYGVFYFTDYFPEHKPIVGTLGNYGFVYLTPKKIKYNERNY